MVVRVIYAYTTSTYHSLINATSELESQFAPITISIHLGPSARVESDTDERGILFKGILMSGLFKAEGQSSK